jgi:hypothetical protein
VKVGDLVRNKNSEKGELGIFMGIRVYKNRASFLEVNEDYECAEVYWPEREKVGTIQANLIEVICATS